MVKILPEGPFFAAKAGVSKPNDRRSQGVFNNIILCLELPHAMQWYEAIFPSAYIVVETRDTHRLGGSIAPFTPAPPPDSPAGAATGACGGGGGGVNHMLISIKPP